MEIKGLKYLSNYISQEEQNKLLEIINKQIWLGDLKRRTQHYGYKYDYKARAVDFSMYLGELPEWAKKLAHRLYEESLVPNLPDQAIVNEYEPGQGISKHVDCKPCFTDGIASLSLGSGCVIDFTKGQEKESLFLEPRSLFIITEEARYKWAHAISSRKTDLWEGKKLERNLRISITFRKVVLSK